MDISRLCAGCTLVLVGALPVFAAEATPDAPNLLANPGFESRTADQPDRWDNFVQPKPGAVARLDNIAHSGAYSVWLHTPTPYAKEPVNNWSQNSIADFGGERLRVSGFIRVAEAKEAALWLQCWRKNPWGVLGTASTSIDMPVYGTSDWQEVSMEFDVPKGTDFVTVRCVLLGTGSAWFDDISLSRILKSAVDGVEKKEPEPAEEPPAEASPPALKPDQEESKKTPASAVSVTAEEAKRQEALVMPLVTRLEAEVRRLREANVLLTDTLQQMQEVNQGLVTEMMAIQATLRERAAEEDARAATPPRPVPPLVPLSEALEGAAP